jgi:hypothetical protein
MTELSIATPEAFNERFVLWLNSEGKPVERTLGEMTGAEVIAALDWISELAEKFRQSAERAQREADELRAYARQRGIL